MTARETEMFRLTYFGIILLQHQCEKKKRKKETRKDALDQVYHQSYQIKRKAFSLHRKSFEISINGSESKHPFRDSRTNSLFVNGHVAKNFTCKGCVPFVESKVQDLTDVTSERNTKSEI